MANWSNPLITTAYTSVLDDLKNRDIDSAVQFSPTYVTALTNTPTGAIRWNPTSAYWEIYSGTAWGALITKYMIDVDKLDGQDGSYYLSWANLTGKPTTFAPSTHTHDDRYYTEAEANARYGALLAVSGQDIKLRTVGGVDLSTITVPYASTAGDASTLTGNVINQNLRTTDSPTFAVLTISNELQLAPGTAADPAIACSEDIETNTGIFWPADDTLAISTTAIERLRVTADGRVGINTSIPTQTLDVNGAVAISRYGTSTPVILGRSARGTESASTALASGDNILAITGRGFGTSAWSTDRAAIYFRAASAWTDASHGTDITFYTTQTGTVANTLRMIIQDDGRVGINTSAPTYQLHVNGSFNATSIAINGTAVSSTAAELNKLDGVTSLTADLNILSGAAAAGVSAAEFQYLNGVTSAIQTQLNAKVGTNNPTFTGTATAPTLRLTGVSDITLASTDHAFQVGPSSGQNVSIDSNEIQARNNGAAGNLSINSLGGTIVVGNTSSAITLNGIVSPVKGDPADTAAAPTFTWNANSGLGMYRASSSAIGWAIAGTNVMTLNNTNLVVHGDTVSRFSSSTTATQTDLPIGHLIACNCADSSTYNRNALIVPRLNDGDTKTYTDGGAGTALVGTWRSRGRIEGTNGAYLLQRVA